MSKMKKDEKGPVNYWEYFECVREPGGRNEK